MADLPRFIDWVYYHFLSQKDHIKQPPHQVEVLYTTLLCQIIVPKRKPINQINKSHNALVLYPTMHHSEQKCAYFCSEWCIVGYETSALWNLWDWSIPALFMMVSAMLSCHTICHHHHTFSTSLQRWMMTQLWLCANPLRAKAGVYRDN